jgi:phosphoribosyl 1,2-cyclic phosphate phosphodiesterase
MNLLFLGTAAAEGFPGLFCNCETCREARALGGHDRRLRSALLVNDDLLIDFGPDLLASSQRFNRSLWGVRTGLVTHAHEDHFYPMNFHMRAPSFTARQPLPPCGGDEALPPCGGDEALPTLALYAPADALAILRQAYPDLDILHLDVHSVGPFENWESGGYQVSSYQAYHAVGRYQCLLYSVDDGQHSFLYATDTGDFPAATWQALAGRSFDVIILEETIGSGEYSQHMNFEHFLEHTHRFRAEGHLRPGGRIIAHHLSHSWNPTHAKVEAVLGPHGVEVAYDGMEVIL